MLSTKAIVVSAIAIIVVLFFGVFILAGFFKTVPTKTNGSRNDLSSFFKFRKTASNISITVTPTPLAKSFVTLWTSDFEGRHIRGLSNEGEIVWDQDMTASPLPWSGFNTNTEYVTVAPNGNLIVADGNGMMVQEIDRVTHKLLWQYGHKDKMSALPGYIHQPDKSFKINDHEVLINDGNNRRVIIVDQRTNDIVWQYGETLRMGKAPGQLMGNTSVVPLKGGEQFAITDTLLKKIIIVERASKKIVWEYQKDDAKWLQHAWPTPDGGFVMEDRQRGEIFEINRAGQILWTLSKLSDGSKLHYPTDVIKLGNGHLLVAEAGLGRVIEVDLQKAEIVKHYKGVGFVTTIAIDQQSV